MCTRFVFFVLCCCVLVHCVSENNNFNRRVEDKNSREVNSNKGSDQVREQWSRSSNTRDGERAVGSSNDNLRSSEQSTGDFHNGENNYNGPRGDSSLNKSNGRQAGSGGQSFGNRPIEGSGPFSNNRSTTSYQGSGGQELFQSRPGNQGESVFGRPVQQSTHSNEKGGFTPTREENNFSGRPTEGNLFGQSGGFGSGNEGHSGRPSGSSTFGQSGRPSESSTFGQSGRPSGSSTFGQSGGFGSGNEGHSGRPSESSTYGQSGRPSGSSTFGQSGRPSEGSTFGQSGRPSEGSTFGQSGRPSGSSTFGQSGRPSEGSTFGQSGRPSEGSTFGQSGRPSEGSTFGQSGRPSEGSTFGQSGRPSEGSTFGQSGRPSEGSTFGQSGRPSGSSTFGQSGRPSEGSTSGQSGRPFGSSTFGQSGEFGPGNEGHSSGRPNGESGFDHSSGLTQEGQAGTATQRPGSHKEPEHSNTGNKPEGEENKGTEDGKEDEKDVCFTHIGCFKMGKPWKSTLRPVGAPHAPEKIQTVVHFYSRENPKQPQNITVYPRVNMGRAHFDPQKISAIIVHGFSNSGNASWMKEMKDVYLRKVDANVMIVDWGKGAQLLNYLQVAGNTRVVGKQLGMFVKYLIEEFGADPGRFHLIGHSLGAQICSYLAKEVPGIARLTALDPAQPGFEGFSKEVRLDQTDAEFVDVIHTDARPFIPTLGFGMMAPHGHVDFYMNGGFDQPGCVPPPKKDLPVIKSFLDFAKFPVETIAKTVACPHARAYEYLIEAFNETDNCIFWGHKTDVKNVFKTVTNTVTQGLFKKFTALSTTCSKDDCIPLGFATKKSPLRGSFVVTTSARSPYCISEPGVPPETLPKDRKEKTFFQKLKETPVLG